MADSLDTLLDDGVIDEVLGRIKSGKEATISMVRRGDLILAAKVYKDRDTRSFKNNVQYKEGRKVRNTRTQRAMDSGGKFGRDSAEQAWKSAEADALYRLVDTGVRTPQPVMFYEGVLLMTLVLDAEGRPAPRLEEITLEREAVMGVYCDLVAQLIALLCCDLVHGDLSPYNVLLAVDGPTIIDFPQVISAAHNTRAEFYFLRDFTNLHSHLATMDPALGVHRVDGRAIWQAYVRRDLTPQFVPPLPPPLPAPRRNERSFAPRSNNFNAPNNNQHSYSRPNNSNPPNNDQRSFSQRPNNSSKPQPTPPRLDDYSASPRPRPNNYVPAPPAPSPPEPKAPAKPAELHPRWTGQDTTRPPQSNRPNGQRPNDRPNDRRPNDRRPNSPNGQRSNGPNQPRPGEYRASTPSQVSRDNPRPGFTGPSGPPRPPRSPMPGSGSNDQRSFQPRPTEPRPINAGSSAPRPIQTVGDHRPSTPATPGSELFGQRRRRRR